MLSLTGASLIVSNNGSKINLESPNSETNENEVEVVTDVIRSNSSESLHDNASKIKSATKMKQASNSLHSMTCNYNTISYNYCGVDITNELWHLDKSKDEIQMIVWNIVRNNVTNNAIIERKRTNEFHLVIQHLQSCLDKDKFQDYVCGYGPEGHTLAHWAVIQHEPIFLHELLKIPNYNLNLPSKDESGMYPIHWASSMGSIYNVNLILKYAENAIEARDKSGCTPFLIASQYGHANLCAFLLKRGANLDAVDYQNAGAIHWASYNGAQNVIGLLAHFSAIDLSKVDSLGHSPLHLAVLQSNTQVLQYMLEEIWIQSGQKKELMLSFLNCKDTEGKTPEDIAKELKKSDYLSLSSACEVILMEWKDRCLLRSSKKKDLLMPVRTCLRQLCSLVNWRLWLGIPSSTSVSTSSTNYNYNTAFSVQEEASFYQQRAISPMILIITLMTASFIMFPLKFWTFPYYTKEVMYLHVSTLTSMTFMWIFYYLTFTTDPGILDTHSSPERDAENDRSSIKSTCCYHTFNYVDSSSLLDKSKRGKSLNRQRAIQMLSHNLQNLYHQTLEQYASSTQTNQNIQLCHSCHIIKPLRSKHCRVQRKCVLLFDHYCPFVGNTIGLYNYHYFYFLLFFLTTSISGYSVCSLKYLEYTEFDIVTLSMLLIISLFFIPCFGMLLYHSCLAMKNLTTNEVQNWKRYSYLNDSSASPHNKKFYNPFDLGIVKNLSIRFFPPIVKENVVQVLPDNLKKGKCDTRFNNVIFALDNEKKDEDRDECVKKREVSSDYEVLV